MSEFFGKGDYTYKCCNCGNTAKNQPKRQSQWMCIKCQIITKKYVKRFFMLEDGGKK